MVSIAEAIRRWKSEGNRSKRLAEAEVIARWDEIVGADISQHTDPVSFEGGRLVVKVNEATWRHQLHFLRHEIVKAINRKTGHRVVNEIVLTG